MASSRVSSGVSWSDEGLRWVRFGTEREEEREICRRRVGCVLDAIVGCETASLTRGGPGRVPRGWSG